MENPRLTIAIGTLGDLTVVREACVGEALEVVFNRLRPTLTEMLALRLGGIEEPNHVLAAELALKIDQAHTVADLLLLHWKSASYL